MKRNITLAIDDQLLKRARASAAQRGLSISGLLAAELQRITAADAAYQKAQSKAIAHLNSPLPLGGHGIQDRDALHDRKNLR